MSIFRSKYVPSIAICTPSNERRKNWLCADKTKRAHRRTAHDFMEQFGYYNLPLNRKENIVSLPKPSQQRRVYSALI